MTQTPRDWNLIAMEEDRDFWKCEFDREKARADAAAEARDKAYNMIGRQAPEISELRKALAESEAREQRLKGTVETAIQLYDMGESSDVYPLIKDILRTLYPDTPAPTLKEDEK